MTEEIGEDTEENGDGGNDGEEATTGELAAAEAQATLFSKKVDEIRVRSDRVANAIASAGSAAVGALGVAKFADVFPYEASCWAAFFLVAGFAFAAFGIFLLYRIFNEVQAPLVMLADLDAIEDDNGDPIDPRELRIVRRIYTNMAELNEVRTLAAYEARGQRYRELAEDSPADAAAKLNARADIIGAEVLGTEYRALHAVVRRRAKRAGVSAGSILAAVALFGGLAVSSVASDNIGNARDEKKSDDDDKAKDEAKETADQDAGDLRKLIRACVAERRINPAEGDGLNPSCIELGIEAEAAPSASGSTDEAGAADEAKGTSDSG